MRKLLFILIVSSIFVGCSRNVKVEYQSSILNWGWPGTYVATDGNIDVEYYSCGFDNCCHIKRQVLQALADKANKGEFSWSSMENTDFRKNKLLEQCEELKYRSVSNSKH